MGADPAAGQAAAQRAGSGVPAPRRLWLPLLAAFAVALGAMLWYVAVDPLDHGFIRYPGLAADMLRSGHLLVPWLDGMPYLQKPPLYLWVLAGPMALVGSGSGWVQHVPSLLSLALLLTFTFLFARRALAPGRGPAPLDAMLVLATTVGTFALLRDKRLDPLFAAWLAGSFYFAACLLTVEATPARRRRWTLAAWVFLAAATLTKGPVAPLFFACVVGAFLAWPGRRQRLVAREQLAGLALFLAVVLAWPLLVVRDLGLHVTLEALRDTVLTSRFAGPFYYLADTPMRFLPWTLLMPAAVLRLVAARPFAERPVLRFALCWLAGVFVPLQLSEAKHYRYLLPAYPALAVLVVALWDGAAPARGRLLAWGDRLRDAGLGGMLAAVLVASVAAPFAAATYGGGHLLQVLAATLVAGASGLASYHGLRQLRRGDSVEALRFVLMGALLLFAGYDGARAWGYTGDPRVTIFREALAPLREADAALAFRVGEVPRTAISLAVGRDPERVRRLSDAVSCLERTPGCLVVTDAEGEGRLAARTPVRRVHPVPVEIAHHDFVLLSAAPPGG